MKDIEEIVLEFPFLPCSVNKAYAGTTRRYKSQDYKDFEAQVEAFFLSLGDKYEIVGDERLSVEYIIHTKLYTQKGKKRKIDTANYEKTLIDTVSKYIKGLKDEYIADIIGKKRHSEEEYTILRIAEISI